MAKSVTPSHYPLFVMMVNAIIKGTLSLGETILAGNLAAAIKNAVVNEGTDEWKDAFMEAYKAAPAGTKASEVEDALHNQMFAERIMSAPGIDEYRQTLLADLNISSEGVELDMPVEQGATLGITTNAPTSAKPSAVLAAAASKDPAWRLDNAIDGFNWTDDAGAPFWVSGTREWSYVFSPSTKEAWLTKDGKTAKYVKGEEVTPAMVKLGGGRPWLAASRKFSTTMPTFTILGAAS